MSLATWKKQLGIASLLILIATLAAPAWAARTSDQTNPWPGDLSPMGMMAAQSLSDDPSIFEPFMAERVITAAREFYRQTRVLGVESRSGRMVVSSLGVPPPNVRANDPAQVPDRVGETQAEVAVAVYGDTIVIGFNDSRAFTVGTSPGVGTISGFAYSTNGGATFTDGGPIPRALATDSPFGDPGVDTDEDGNWYYNQIYTRAAGAPGPTAQQNIGVHHGRFNGAGVLVWDLPVMASIGTAATGNLDKCLLAADRFTGNVYTAYTRFTATPQIEIVRSTTLGATWDPAVVLDATAVPTASKQAARPMCGPGGEVYVVWEKGANLINCPDPVSGIVTNTTGNIGFARSLNFGVTYTTAPAATGIGTVEHSWTWSGPGDLRERANEFPDIAVDRSGGPFNGRIYVTWHESANWSSNLSAGPGRAEAADAANNNPGGAELFVVGENVTGTMSAAADFDYWTFAATAGTTYFFNLDPNTFNCGITGSGGAGMRLRLWATQAVYPVPTAFPDTLLAASALGAFAQRIVWTCPVSGNYLLRLQSTSGTTPYPYLLRVRPLAFGAPNAGRDGRDVVVIQSSDLGVTWSGETRVNDDAFGLENRRPFIATDGIGHVHVYWHDSRVPGLGTSAALTSVIGATSRDGGASWTPNYCVTDQLSFFSFNTIAVPNLGDYNQVAGYANCVIPAWSDHRQVGGDADVRNPAPPPTFTAGVGPDTWTTVVRFLFEPKCPGDTVVQGGTSVTRNYCVTNTGTIVDSYNYTVADVLGWAGFPAAGTIGPLNPGQTGCVSVTFTAPADCVPGPVDVVTFSATPVGDPDGTQACVDTVLCETPVAALVSSFGARNVSDGVELTWSSYAPGVSGWNLYRSVAREDGYALLNPTPISMGAGGDFRYLDQPEASGTVYYRLAAVRGDGREQIAETIAFGVGVTPRVFSFALAGANPFRETTSFTYGLPERSPVHIEVFNATGKRVATLVNRTEEAGVYTVPFDLATNARGLGAGVYQVRITAGRYARTIQAIALP